jgi:hypothetical protein
MADPVALDIGFRDVRSWHVLYSSGDGAPFAFPTLIGQPPAVDFPGKNATIITMEV